MTAKTKTRVAILGGGIAALTAAFEVTEQDPNRSAYDITLYTIGWRLGGKASVGRDMASGGRAVEHGLHIWTGYYDNSFDIVKRLYARLKKPADAWKKCFEPVNHFTAMEYIDGKWKPWLLQFPQNDLEPGIGELPLLTPLPLFIQFLSALEDGFNRSSLPIHMTREFSRQGGERDSAGPSYPGAARGRGGAHPGARDRRRLLRRSGDPQPGEGGHAARHPRS